MAMSSEWPHPPSPESPCTGHNLENSPYEDQKNLGMDSGKGDASKQCHLGQANKEGTGQADSGYLMCPKGTKRIE